MAATRQILVVVVHYFCKARIIEIGNACHRACCSAFKVRVHVRNTKTASELGPGTESNPFPLV
jgi:hypothetical protein